MITPAEAARKTLEQTLLLTQIEDEIDDYLHEHFDGRNAVVWNNRRFYRDEWWVKLWMLPLVIERYRDHWRVTVKYDDVDGGCRYLVFKPRGPGFLARLFHRK